jgi:uncharacterized protein (TIGR03663 family)
MRQKFALAAVLLCILAAALVLRLPNLDARPFHGDEAVHAFKFRELWEQGRYEYDPEEYHGPTLYYAALPVVAARGRASFTETRESDYRLPIALLGAAMVLLLPLLRDGLGPGGSHWAALLLAVSTPFVFYSRYFIQEVVLVAFTLALIACWWRYRVAGRTVWLMSAAVAAGVVVATKETSVLTLGALGLAWLVSRAALPPGIPTGRTVATSSATRYALAALLSLAVAFVFLSGFFSHVRGPFGYLETYTHWLGRAGDTDLHRHPESYYLSLLAWRYQDGLVWSEAWVLGLAAVGGWAALFGKPLERTGADPGFARFVVVYTVALTVIYSLIPYKTPWNLLSFYLGFVLLGGLGAATLLSLARPAPVKAAAALVLLAGAGHLAWQAQRTTFDYRDNRTGPYVYAQPLRGVREIEQRIIELAAFSPQKSATVAQVIFPDNYYWPLPWYLRHLENVGYWVGDVPEEREARLTETPIIVSSADFDDELSALLDRDHFMVGFHGLRPGVMVQVWVKSDLWEPFVLRRTPGSRTDD